MQSSNGALRVVSGFLDGFMIFSRCYSSCLKYGSTSRKQYWPASTTGNIRQHGSLSGLFHTRDRQLRGRCQRHSLRSLDFRCDRHVKVRVTARKIWVICFRIQFDQSAFLQDSRMHQQKADIQSLSSHVHLNNRHVFELQLAIFHERKLRPPLNSNVRFGQHPGRRNTARRMKS